MKRKASEGSGSGSGSGSHSEKKSKPDDGQKLQAPKKEKQPKDVLSPQYKIGASSIIWTILQKIPAAHSTTGAPSASVAFRLAM